MEELLAKCHRRCCICHKFCGTKMQIHHIQYQSKGGKNDLENLIPLCLDCHAEVNHYNNEHPIGRKFSEKELILHKDQWFEICKKKPEILAISRISKDAGALEGLLQEIRINLAVCTKTEEGYGKAEVAFPLFEKQYIRALEEGVTTLLSESLLTDLTDAYIDIQLANACVGNIMNARDRNTAEANSEKQYRVLRDLKEKLNSLNLKLNEYLRGNQNQSKN